MKKIKYKFRISDLLFIFIYIYLFYSYYKLQDEYKNGWVGPGIQTFTNNEFEDLKNYAKKFKDKYNYFLYDDLTYFVLKDEYYSYPITYFFMHADSQNEIIPNNLGGKKFIGIIRDHYLESAVKNKFNFKYSIVDSKKFILKNKEFRIYVVEIY